MRKTFFYICFLGLTIGWSQNVSDSLTLGFNEYLGYVKKYHPIAQQAQLAIPMAQANLMKARGAFDPKIEVDYDTKEFKGTEYWNRLNTTFKIPTYFGIVLKGNFAQNEGQYLNRDDYLPDDGLYSAGISMSLAQGLWINERMATLRQAKLFREQAKADQDLLVNQILYDASLAYFDWVKAHKQYLALQTFLKNAEIRYRGIQKSAQAGDRAAIDTVEAKIALQNRKLSLSEAQLSLTQKRLELSNFLWIEFVPVELQPEVIPDFQPEIEVETTLDIFERPIDSFSRLTHPKIRSLEYKVASLKVDKRLKTNKLLPKVDVEYNFLTESPKIIDSYLLENYKGGLRIDFPLFLRKERGDLKLAKFKFNDAQFELDNVQVQIENKIKSIYAKLDALNEQNQLMVQMVIDYQTLFQAEERKFSFGESSLFLVNSREGKLLDAQLKQIDYQNKLLMAKADLFKILALNPAL